MSVTEAASALGVSRQSVLNVINPAKLPATHIGDTWVLREAAINAHARRSA
ncbi:helix-turn-helix domain-containing protein [Prescottella defluvii]|nr:helix-turn-helix domain-containing protein [Prescottella defluvii]